MGASVELDCYPTFWGSPKHTCIWNQGPLDMDMKPEIVLLPHDDEAEFGLNFHSKSLFHRLWQSHGLTQLREASPDVNIEVESVLVSTYPIRFRCPVVLMRYLNTTSTWQLNRLRSIIVELSACCEECCIMCKPWRSWFKTCDEGWIAAIERLPAAIKLIKFELGWIYLYLGDQSTYVNEMLAQLEIVSKKTQRLAPDAKIKVSDLRALRFMDCDILRGITDEIENHSEDYKKWWRESREKTQSQMEEA